MRTSTLSFGATVIFIGGLLIGAASQSLRDPWRNDREMLIRMVEHGAKPLDAASALLLVGQNRNPREAGHAAYLGELP
ncbi:hypothetical protein CGLAMM_01250 [Acetobacteraceae bacterium EV16G]|uniref:Uncharacterized protein n=1 Tax=Sorlinia euscelidii TaxID=3081148 RepID=A0ABU7U1S1_9PROT